MAYVEQFVNPERIKNQIKQLGSTNGSVARLAKISEGHFSQVLAGERALSLPAQIELLRVLDFLRHLRKSTALPLDLTAVDLLAPLFDEFKNARDESKVIRSDAEERAATAQAR